MEAFAFALALNCEYNCVLWPLQKITEQKLQAFQIGTMGQRPLSRREQDERRKKQEAIEAASVFQEFVETFEGSGTSSKVWVKAGTYDAGSRSEYLTGQRFALCQMWALASFFCFTNATVFIVFAEEDSREKGKLYKPTSKLEEKLSSTEKALEYVKVLTKPDTISKKNRVAEKKKSNLELFKEELRQYVSRDGVHQFPFAPSVSVCHCLPLLVPSAGISESARNVTNINRWPNR